MPNARRSPIPPRTQERTIKSVDARIYLCYRRVDSAYPAHAIHERLTSRFGRQAVFFDVESIPLGVDFRTYIQTTVGECDVMLVLIGDRWLTARIKSGQRRLDSPNDFVRIEIETALQRDIPVIPVLLGRASMPTAEQLPSTLANLAYRNAAEVRTGRDFENHLERLMGGIERVLAGTA